MTKDSLDIINTHFTVDQFEVNHSGEHVDILQTCLVTGFGSLQFFGDSTTNSSFAFAMQAISRCCIPTPHETEH